MTLKFGLQSGDGDGGLTENKDTRTCAAGQVWRANTHHCAKFRADRSNRSGDTAIFRFFKMTAVVAMVIFIAVQNLFVICIVLLKICYFQYFAH